MAWNLRRSRRINPQRLASSEWWSESGAVKVIWGEMPILALY